MKPILVVAACGVLTLGAQEPAYFKEPDTPWWRPKGELLLEAERLPSLEEDYRQDAHRERALLELAWSRPWSFVTADLAVRGALGSDGNQFNLARYDQRPSNGGWVQRASLSVVRLRESSMASATLGLQPIPLLSQESLWDHDLALTGLGARAAYRNDQRGILEAGLRVVAGRVRTFPDQAVDVRAAQAVLRLEWGAVEGFVHLDRWDVRWRPGEERFEPLPDGDPVRRQVIRLDAVGLGAAGVTGLPWEVKGFAHRNLATGETGGEFQVWLGPATRPFRPRVGYIHQRLAATGTAFAPGSDEWWFLFACRGSLFVVQLPLRSGLRLSLTQLAHIADGDPRGAKRTTLALAWRF